MEDVTSNVGGTFAVGGTMLTGVVGQVALAVAGICAARAMGVESRGHLALLMLVPLILVQLGGMGVPTAVTFAAARAGTLTSLPRRVVALALTQAVVVLLVNGAIFALLLSGEEQTVRLAAALVLPAAPAWLLLNYGLGALQGRGRLMAFNVLRALPVVLYAFAASALFAIGSHSIAAFAIAWSLTWPISAVSTLVVLRRCETRPEADGGVGTLVGFGLRALPGVSSPLESFRLDQAFVGVFLSAFDLGLYVVAVAFSTLPRLLASSVGAVVYPQLASVTDRELARSMGSRAVVLTSGVCLAAVILLIVAAPSLIEITFGAEFSEASTATRILLLGALLAAIRRVIGDVERGLGRPAVASVGELASWISAIPLIAVLLPSHGLEGVAAALSVAAGTSLLVVILAAKAVNRERQ
jgi:O-antigen/teichoic acid export membrane protein